MSQNLESFKKERIVKSVRYCLMRTDTPSVSDGTPSGDFAEGRRDKAETGLD